MPALSSKSKYRNLLIINNKKYPLLLIEWVDSTQPSGQWVHLENLPEPQAIKCVTVGWLIGETSGVKMLAQNLGDIDSKDNQQASGIIHIPNAAIQKVMRLREGC